MALGSQGMSKKESTASTPLYKWYVQMYSDHDKCMWYWVTQSTAYLVQEMFNMVDTVFWYQTTI